MNVTDLLQQLVLDGWRFWLEEGRLRYRAPQAAATPAQLDQLKALKPEIVRLLTEEPHLLDVCPLSYGQAALWFLWKLAPESIAYNQSLPLRVGGAEGGGRGARGRGATTQEPEAKWWRRACEALVAQQPVLRTVFPTRAGAPIQQVLPPGAIAWTTVDAGEWSAGEMADAMAAAHALPFDLEVGPLIRFAWFAGHPEEDGGAGHTLLITMHHIVCDGWSLELIRRTLAALTAAQTGLAQPPAAAPPTLPPLAHTYHDYVRWQNALLDGPEGERLWRFWREQLAGPLPTLDLPVDHPRPRVQSYAGASCPVSLPPALCQELQRLAKAEGATTYEVLLAAFLALLYRFTGQRDLLIGVPSAGRSRSEFAPIVGYFVNPIVVRAAVSEGQTFRELLQEVRSQARRALEHAEFPFPLLVRRLHPDRDADRSPIFDVTMNYLARRSEAAGADRLEVVEIAQADGKFDLTLTMEDEEGRLSGALGYNVALFEPATVQRLSAHLTSLLHSAAADPDCAVDGLALETGRLSGRQGPLPAICGPQCPVAATEMLHLRFAEQARRRPDAPAVRDAATTLTYAQLAARSAALAARLCALGVGRDARIGICTDRSVDFVVAMLAVLQAGAAYVPLDPGHPDELLGYMMSHAQIAALLAQRRLLPEFPTHLLPAGCSVIGVDEPAAWLAGGTADSTAGSAAAAVVDLHDLAYVMYTSGSTGRPKAVAIEHAAVANYTASIIREFAVDAPYNFLLASTFSADLGNTVIFPSLGTGGCLHILPEQARLDPRAFAAFMVERRIDYLKIVPSHLAALAGEPIVADALPRRALILGGERAAPAWVAALQQAAPDCRIYNHYGPTETTVGVLVHPAPSAGAAPASASLPLSRAVANTAIYVLDAGQQAVPAGAVGELYIGGLCLARGYLDDPAHTQASFVTVRHADSGAAHVLYRTGDLARQAADGSLEILGRRDRQIKLRGYRIELAQIEGVLRQAAGVQQAAVITDRDGPQATTLLAFVTPEHAAHAGAERAAAQEQLAPALQRHLAQHLPRHMLPSRIMVLDNLPLTANGKLDVQALRQIEAPPPSNQSSILPRDQVELALCQLWAEVLDRPQVSITDNFFDLGGHSLLAVRLTGRIEERFGLWIPLAALLTHPTVEALAQVIRASGRGWESSLLVPLHAGRHGSPLIFLPGAGGSIMYFAPAAQHLGGGQGVWGVQALGLAPGDVIPQTVEEIAERYLDVIGSQLGTQEPWLLAGHSFGGLVAFEMACQLAAARAPAPRICIIDNPAPLADGVPDYADYDHADWLVHIATRIGKLNGMDLRLTRAEVAGASSEAQNAQLVDLLLRWGLLPPEVTASYFSRFIDVYRANARAAALYRPAAALLPIDLVLLRAAEEDADLGGPRRGGDPTWGWARFTAQPVRTVDLPGTHLSLFAEPNVTHLAAALRSWIADAW